MKILILGAGKMGSFFIDLLSFEHEVAVFEKDPKRMRFTYNCQRMTEPPVRLHYFRHFIGKNWTERVL